MELLIVLALYSVAVLLFVPLERIGKIQASVKKTIKRWLSRIND